MSNQQNANFLSNPEGYLQTISTANKFNLGGKIDMEVNLDEPHAKILMNLRPLDGGLFSSTKRVEAEYGISPKISDGDSIIVGAWVPYHVEGDVASGASSLGKVPIATRPGPTDPKFVFTGAMNGCSMVVARNEAGQLFAVHYPNSTGFLNGFPLLKADKLEHVKSINYEGAGGYGEDRTELEKLPKAVWSNAFCCLAFQEGEWKVLGQSQLVTPNGAVFETRINPAKGLITA